MQWETITGTSFSIDEFYTWAYPSTKDGITYQNYPCVVAQWITSGNYTRNNITSLSTTSCTVRGTDTPKTGIVLFAIGV